MGVEFSAGGGMDDRFFKNFDRFIGPLLSERTAEPSVGPRCKRRRFLERRQSDILEPAQTERLTGKYMMERTVTTCLDGAPSPCTTHLRRPLERGNRPIHSAADSLFLPEQIFDLELTPSCCNRNQRRCAASSMSHSAYDLDFSKSRSVPL